MAGRIVCAWCGADMGTTEAEGTSHGICQGCSETEIAKSFTALTDWIDLRTARRKEA